MTRTILMTVMAAAVWIGSCTVEAQETASRPGKTTPEQWSKLRTDREALLKEIADLERELPDLKAKEGQLPTYQTNFTRATTELNSARAQKRTADLPRLEQAVAELEPRVTDLKAAADRRRQIETTLRDRKDRLAALEGTIGSLLTPEILFQSFKTWMSGIFAGLVLVVMAGFFAIAWRDVAVRRAVFTGAAGIQFVTLFSLVIAIILFGITGILEGKELAALLGGLSGYILGRGVGPAAGSRSEREPQTGPAGAVESAPGGAPA